MNTDISQIEATYPADSHLPYVCATGCELLARACRTQRYVGEINAGGWRELPDHVIAAYAGFCRQKVESDKRAASA